MEKNTGIVKKNMGAWVLALLLSAGAAVFPAAAAEWIESFKGKPGDYLIQRGAQKLPPQPLLRLQAGDKIFVMAPAGQIGILKADKSILQVTRKNAPYIVPNTTEGSTVWDNLLNIASGWIGDKAGGSTLTGAVTRGGVMPVQVISAPAEQNLLLAGEPALAVVWSGGARPYRAVLIDTRTSKVVLARSNIKRRDVVLDLPALTPGPYRLEIASLGGGRRMLTAVDIRVVETSELPGQARDLLASTLPSRLKTRLLVTLLAQRPPWRFQAYDLARRNQLHAALLALENGRYPKRR